MSEGPVATTRGYRGGSYRRRSTGSRLVLYGLLVAVAIWLIGPFVWLFITSISYQRNLMARPLSFIPPEITLDNYKMIFGLVRFHAEGQAAKIIPSMLNSLVVASVVTALNLVIGTTAGYAYARYRFPLKTLSLFALLFTRMLPTVVLIPASRTNKTELASIPLDTAIPKRAAVIRGAVNACGLSNVVPAIAVAPEAAREKPAR